MHRKSFVVKISIFPRRIKSSLAESKAYMDKWLGNDLKGENYVEKLSRKVFKYSSCLIKYNNVFIEICQF